MLKLILRQQARLAAGPPEMALKIIVVQAATSLPLCSLASPAWPLTLAFLCHSEYCVTSLLQISMQRTPAPSTGANDMFICIQPVPAQFQPVQRVEP